MRTVKNCRYSVYLFFRNHQAGGDRCLRSGSTKLVPRVPTSERWTCCSRHSPVDMLLPALAGGHAACSICVVVAAQRGVNPKTRKTLISRAQRTRGVEFDRSCPPSSTHLLLQQYYTTRSLCEHNRRFDVCGGSALFLRDSIIHAKNSRLQALRDDAHLTGRVPAYRRYAITRKAAPGIRYLIPAVPDVGLGSGSMIYDTTISDDL